MLKRINITVSTHALTVSTHALAVSMHALVVSIHALNAQTQYIIRTDLYK